MTLASNVGPLSERCRQSVIATRTHPNHNRFSFRTSDNSRNPTSFRSRLQCLAMSKLLRLGHSPDPDDAFMFYALARDLIPTGDWKFEHVLQDIQTLNQRARNGELEITAISIHAYPYVADKYALTSCGSSMGDNYGPMVIARSPMTLEDLKGKTIA